MLSVSIFRIEEAKNRDSEAVKKREEALLRAKQKAKDSAIELRRKERQAMLLARCASRNPCCTPTDFVPVVQV
jgi:hypothetical protein